MLDEQDRGPAVIRLCVGMIAVSVVSIILRFWSRAVTVRSKGSNNVVFWWDDWLALAAVPFTLAQCSMIIDWTRFGLGKHVDVVPLPKISEGLKLLFIGYHWYHLSTILSKLSALAFYIRVFSRNNNNKLDYAIKFGIALSLTYYITFLFIDIFECTPVRKAWQPEIPGHCISTYYWWLWFAIVSIFVDVVILTIPMPLLWKLQLKPLKRVGIIGLFAAGYCVVLISIGRTIAVSIVGDNLEKDITYQAVPILVWLTAEPGISTLSICLPSIFSLLKRGVEYGPEALFSSKTITDLYSGRTPRFGGTKVRKSANGTITIDDDPFERLHDNNLPENVEYYAMACKGSSKPNSVSNEDVSNQSIQVRREYNVHHEEAFSRV